VCGTVDANTCCELTGGDFSVHEKGTLKKLLANLARPNQQQAELLKVRYKKLVCDPAQSCNSATPGVSVTITDSSGHTSTADVVLSTQQLASGVTYNVDCADWHPGWANDEPSGITVLCSDGSISERSQSCKSRSPCDTNPCQAQEVCEHTGPGNHTCNVVTSTNSQQLTVSHLNASQANANPAVFIAAIATVTGVDEGRVKLVAVTTATQRRLTGGAGGATIEYTVSFTNKIDDRVAVAEKMVRLAKASSNERQYLKKVIADLAKVDISEITNFVASVATNDTSAVLVNGNTASGASPITGTLSATDDDGSLTYSLVAGSFSSAKGTPTVTSDGSYSYTANAGFFGDTFLIRSTDPLGGHTDFTVTVVVPSCDASVPPTNGAAGNCTTTLAFGATCQPACVIGFATPGVASCSTAGVFTPTTCDILRCDASGSIANGDSCGICRTCTGNMLHGESCTTECDAGYTSSTTTCNSGILSIPLSAVCTPNTST
tara:strand:+ start:476 stop:1948 length:1473 start_codon:yes stop_codon:yes gene_type:complete